MMSEKFTEFDKTGRGILTLVNTAMEITEIMFNVHFRQPRHDIARRFLNHICEFKSEAAQDQEARLRAAREVKENVG
jgi:hypothetical protein